MQRTRLSPENSQSTLCVKTDPLNTPNNQASPKTLLFWKDKHRHWSWWPRPFFAFFYKHFFWVKRILMKNLMLLLMKITDHLCSRPHPQSSQLQVGTYERHVREAGQLPSFNDTIPVSMTPLYINHYPKTKPKLQVWWLGWYVTAVFSGQFTAGISSNQVNIILYHPAKFHDNSQQQCNYSLGFTTTAKEPFSPMVTCVFASAAVPVKTLRSRMC